MRRSVIDECQLVEDLSFKPWEELNLSFHEWNPFCQSKQDPPSGVYEEYPTSSVYDQCHGVKDLNNSFFHLSPRPTSNIHSNDAASSKVEISVVQALLFCLTFLLFGI